MADLIDAPEIFSRFIPTFDTLFLNVKDTSPAELTDLDHPFGWLLSVLQQESSDKETLRQTLLAALSSLDGLEPAHTTQHRTALLFLCHLILYRRPEEEQSDLMRLIQNYTQDAEVDKVIKSAAETYIERE